MCTDNKCATCSITIGQTEMIGVDGDDVYCQYCVVTDIYMVFPLDLGTTTGFYIMEPNSTKH